MQISCHVMSCHVMSCHVMSCHVMSCHVMSYHISFSLYDILQWSHCEQQRWGVRQPCFKTSHAANAVATMRRYCLSFCKLKTSGRQVKPFSVPSDVLPHKVSALAVKSAGVLVLSSQQSMFARLSRNKFLTMFLAWLSSATVSRNQTGMLSQAHLLLPSAYLAHYQRIRIVSLMTHQACPVAGSLQDLQEEWRH